MTRAERAAYIDRRLAALYPQTPIPLAHKDPFTLLVAVLLSAQSTDKGVNKITPALFALADTPEKMRQLPVEKIREIIRPCGLSPAKARAISELSRLLVERHGGQVPRDREALEALPGVGRKTANVVLNVAFGEDAMAVDTHIFRVSNRTGLAPGKTPLEVEERLMQRVPKAYLQDAHHWLILHGRYVCVARLPKCWQCAVARWCDYQPKTPPPALQT